MKVPIALFCLALSAASVAAGSASPSPAPSSAPLSKWQRRQRELYRDSAPADEYFGKMKMSYLGMNNTFRDAAISSGEHTTDAAIANKVALAEDALDAWARKYPNDPQLARTYYLATVVERKIWLQPDQARAWTYLNQLVHQFPDSYFGKVLKRDLAIGFTEHYFADAVACPTAPPTAPPIDEGVDALFVPPPPGISVATPAPTPLPSPAPTQLQPGLSVVVLPQPCVPRRASLLKGRSDGYGRASMPSGG